MSLLVATMSTGGPYEELSSSLMRRAVELELQTKVIAMPDLGNWHLNTAQKPRAVLEALEVAEDLGIEHMLFLDADATIKKRPTIHLQATADLMLRPTWPAKIGGKVEARRYKRHVLDYGSMWQSGILFLRTGKGIARNDYVGGDPVRYLVETWGAACERDPWTWDQVHLQRVFWDLTPDERPTFEALPYSYSPGNEYFGHDSAYHKFAKPDDPVKLLVLGSGRDLPRWYERHVRQYVDAGYWIVAFNNAWRVARREMNFWYHPLDFDDRGERPEGDHFERNPEWQKQSPYWLHGTFRVMFVDLLCHLLNEAVADGRKLVVHVAGCDFNYPAKEGETSHFYGVGGFDPLRFGREELAAALEKVQGFYRNAGAILLNASEERSTFLPFPRIPWELTSSPLSGGMPL